MCDLCDELANCLPTTTAAELDQVMAIANTAEKSGVLERIDSHVSIRDRQAGSPLPKSGAPIRQTWMCTQCSRMFLLELNTSQTLGDGWRPLFGN